MIENPVFHVNQNENSDPVVIHFLSGEVPDPEPIKKPEPVIISGSIFAPMEFYKNGVEQIEAIGPFEAPIVYYQKDTEKPFIALHWNQYDSDISSKVTGQLQLNKDFTGLGLNYQKRKVTELRNYLKTRAYLFLDKKEYSDILSKLHKFNARVTRIVSDEDDSRGNTKKLNQTSLESEISESFTLKMPLFNLDFSLYPGYRELEKDQIIEFEVHVEVIIEDGKIYLTLVNYQSDYLRRGLLDKLMNNQLTAFKEQGIPVICTD